MVNTPQKKSSWRRVAILAERDRIYQGRFEELQQEIMIGVEASLRGEVVDSETVFSQL